MLKNVRGLFRSLLRAYVFIFWYVQLVLDLFWKKRDSSIHITDLSIIHHGGGLLVVDKCPELLINSRQPWLRCLTLQMQIFFAFPQYANFGMEHMFHFVNRLDAPTSGLICIAYTSKMAGMVGKAFQNRNVQKSYLAVVWGHVDDVSARRRPNYAWNEKYAARQGAIDIQGDILSACRILGDYQYLIDLPIGEFRFTWPDGRRQKIVTPTFYTNCIKPQSSQTKVTVLKHGYLDGLPASFLRLEPITGRRHQLRVHCAVGLGHPIAGDLIYARLYCTDVAHESANYKLERMMLHADSLKINFAEKTIFNKGAKKTDRNITSTEKTVSFNLFSTRRLFPESGRSKWEDESVFYEP